MDYQSLDFDALKRQLIHDEGLRLKPYKDSVGKVTIGVGRNLDDKGISESEADVLLANDILEHVHLLDVYVTWWRRLDAARQGALVNMAFNLGVGPSPEQPNGKLLTFSSTLAALQRGDYATAAANLRMSKWTKQVGTRAVRIINTLEGVK